MGEPNHSTLMYNQIIPLFVPHLCCGVSGAEELQKGEEALAMTLLAYSLSLSLFFFSLSLLRGRGSGLMARDPNQHHEASQVWQTSFD